MIATQTQELTHEWLTEPAPDQQPQNRLCATCAGDLHSPRSTYCSDACRQAAYRDRKPAEDDRAGF